MPNPLLIPIQFAKNGIKNTIQKVMQAGQDPEDATWSSGWGQRTMIPKEDGGLAPKGQDFNGVLYTLSDHAVHRQNGNQIVFSSDVVAEYGGYAQNSIIQSDDGLRHFRSLIDNNTFNPNTQSIVGRWEVYAGVGSVPSATSTIAGVMRVINNVTSTDVGAALSAAQGKQLSDWIDVVIYSPIPYPLSTPPNGFLVMQGQTINQSQYPKLYSLYGAKLPDMRGQFLRGLDRGRGTDVGRIILSEQGDDIKSHSHATWNRNINIQTATGAGHFSVTSDQTGSTGSTGGTETRPKNIAFLYIVKAG